MIELLLIVWLNRALPSPTAPQVYPVAYRGTGRVDPKQPPVSNS
jgi:hypothetical protein